MAREALPTVLYWLMKHVLLGPILRLFFQPKIIEGAGVAVIAGGILYATLVALRGRLTGDGESSELTGLARTTVAATVESRGPAVRARAATSSETTRRAATIGAIPLE